MASKVSKISWFPENYRFGETCKKLNRKINNISVKKDFYVRKELKTKIIKNQPIPPWMQAIDITPHFNKKSAVNFSDFMSSSMKRHASLILEPTKHKAKIKAHFRGNELKLKQKKLLSLCKAI